MEKQWLCDQDREDRKVYWGAVNSETGVIERVIGLFNRKKLEDLIMYDKLVILTDDEARRINNPKQNENSYDFNFI